mgnify:FL=1
MSLSSRPTNCTLGAVDAMRPQIAHHMQVATLGCQISTFGRTMDAMLSEIANDVQMALFSCAVGSVYGTMRTVGSKISNDVQMADYRS